MCIITSHFNKFSPSEFKLNLKELKLTTNNNLATVEQRASK